MKKLVFFIVLLGLVANASAATDLYVPPVYHGIPYITYWMLLGESITVCWKPDLDSSEHQVRLFHVEDSTYVKCGWTDGTCMDIIAPANSGHYIVEVRSKDLAGNIGKWAKSTRRLNSVVDGKHKAWWLYCY